MSKFVVFVQASSHCSCLMLSPDSCPEQLPNSAGGRVAFFMRTTAPPCCGKHAAGLTALGHCGCRHQLLQVWLSYMQGLAAAVSTHLTCCSLLLLVTCCIVGI